MEAYTGKLEGWNALISLLPGAHFLQTSEWAAAKEPVGWKPLPLVWKRPGGEICAAALVLTRSLTLAGMRLPVRILYAPRGPLLDWSDRLLRRRVLDDLQGFARKQGAILMKIDPEVVTGLGLPGTEDHQAVESGLAVEEDLLHKGWRYSSSQVQFRSTVVIDLAPSEEELLERMKQKTRYNVRLADRKGVKVRIAQPADLPNLYHMYAETSVRDGFVIREEAYYRRTWQVFMNSRLAEGLVASVDGEDIAGVIIFRFGGRTWYVYGMSRDAHREKMPNYLLQWEAIRRARAAGCREYDLWGAPEKSSPDDPLWNVYRFKEGLGGQARLITGAWDYPARPALYTLYTRILPMVLDIMRQRGKARTRQEVISL